MDNSLCVLVTRPSPHGERLSQLIQETGDHAIFLPTIIIAPWHDISEAQQLFAALDHMDWIIFISQEAVRHAQPFLPESLPASLQIAAIGKATQKMLEEKLDITVDLLPENEYTSEGLLSTKAFKNIKNKRVLIVKGASGRTQLSDVLRERGAVVHHAVVYQRTLPKKETHAEEETLLQHANTHEKLVSIVTSGESLSNLHQLIRSETWQTLLPFPIIVPSSRIEKIARELGFRDPWICPSLDDQTILTLLNNIREKRYSKGNTHD